jgi:hypothetical protein
MMKNCPVYRSLEGVREFIYGVLGEDPEPSKYLLGGCNFWVKQLVTVVLSVQLTFVKISIISKVDSFLMAQE